MCRQRRTARGSIAGSASSKHRWHRGERAFGRYGRYLLADGEIAFYLGIDRATEPARRVKAKLGAYRQALAADPHRDRGPKGRRPSCRGLSRPALASDREHTRRCGVSHSRRPAQCPAPVAPVKRPVAWCEQNRPGGELPLAVWACAQRTSQWQRHRRYLPESTATSPSCCPRSRAKRSTLQRPGRPYRGPNVRAPTSGTPAARATSRQ
jgi:hypothetical protein